ncbi:alpha/beta hydrolase family protein [Chryseobacterium viscerum]|uniref:Peptidase S9 prolyl oligopeptidase catalytic domain-containing protein n=1 Tax=Chryseobacterium viscerum TaxID=1037377 RepID=A0A316WRR9_9FLAO|nr:prolyl oligopeptidase family serine peptidase [Chryseobacterium viscerum]PWN64142.1 hypothetical protein C1634_005990 [Chryseobacterium viscerum]
MKKSIFILWLLILFISSNWYPAQKAKDTLQSWMSKFYKIGNLEYSENGRWVTVKKWYDYNSDTIMVFNTQKSRPPFIGNLIRMGNISFLGDSHLLASDLTRAEYWNLKKNERIFYSNVKKTAVLVFLSGYCILDENGTFTVFSSVGEKVNQIEHVIDFQVAQSERKLYVYRKIDSLFEILDVSLANVTKLYSTKSKIEKIEISPSGKLLIIKENYFDNSKQGIVFINTANGKIVKPEGISTKYSDFVEVREIQQGKAYLISSNSYFKPQDKTLVDIWYGNDSDLAAKKYGVREYRYWLWRPGSIKALSIPNDKFSTITSLNNDRYLLAFNPTEQHNYITWKPQLNVHLYDTKQGTYRFIGALKGKHYESPEIICSPNGKSFLASEDGKKWTFFDVLTLNKTIIAGENIQNPVFTVDGLYIFFESPDDLWRYEIKTNKLIKLGIAPRKNTQIMTYEKSFVVEDFNFFNSTVDQGKPMLLKTSNMTDNKISYLTFHNDQAQEVIAYSNKNIKEIKHDKNMQNFCTIEENYNTPPQLFLTDLQRKSKVMLYKGNIKDKVASILRQDIINYTNSQGKQLKGLLYYPENYDPKQKYPMVVRIYQVQSDTSSKYHAPGYINPIGFDLRTLVQNGYFVYLPDIVFSESGTGLSALDCVENAINAISSNSNIDIAKIGLIGQSHGGYETNFIATHSNRFATYISGAANSDIIRSYFSYNNNFNSPFYWQYENGQYEMKGAFATNKELYFKNNPIYNVEKVNAPILLWAGKKDENIAWDQTMEFYIGLKRNQKQVIALFYPNQGHSLGINTEERKDLNRRILEWWDYFLKDKKNVPWINKQIKKDA